MTIERSAAYSASGAMATENCQRQWRFGYAAPSAGGHPLLPLFSGSTYGFLYDGTVSVFATDVTGLTPCATSGVDPVAYVEDVSGLDRDGTQATAINQPEYTVNGGIKGWKAGFFGGQRHWIERTATIGTDWCMWIVCKMGSSGNSVAVTTVDNGSLYGYYSADNDAVYAYENGSQNTTGSANLDNTVCVLRFWHASDGSLYSRAYDRAGNQLTDTASANGADVIGAVTWDIGTLRSSNQSEMYEFFVMFLDRAPVASDDTAIFSHINSNFGGLS